MNKIEKLINWFENKGPTIVALSGGVDSSLVAYAAYRKLGKSALAVIADYKTLAKEELETAKKICKEIGINYKVINYNELENPDFVLNNKNRCFYCRSELSNHLNNLAKEKNFKTIVDGTNIDDLGDYRPGITAMEQNGIQSPLVETHFTKNQVREAAKIAGLSIYDRPSNSCLASRIPWGQRVTAEKLARIEFGERIVKEISHAKIVRVRDLDGIAKIEVGIDEIPLLKNPIKFEKIREKLFEIGYSSVLVDSEGYQPGKINVIVD